MALQAKQAPTPGLTWRPNGCVDVGVTGLNSPVYNETFVGSLLVAHGADPGGLLLVHLQVQGGVEALQVRAGDCPARHRQPHLPQLREEKQRISLIKQ